MTAKILQFDIEMKKTKRKHPLSESEIPASLGALRDFRAEMNSRLSAHDHQFTQLSKGIEALNEKMASHDIEFRSIHNRFESVDSRFDSIDKRFDAVDARFESMEKRFDAMDARFESMERRFDAVDSRFEAMEKRFGAVDARFDELDAKIDRRFDELSAQMHRMLLIMEEQNLRNRQAYDGYLVMYETVQDLKNRIKPECFKD